MVVRTEQNCAVDSLSRERRRRKTLMQKRTQNCGEEKTELCAEENRELCRREHRTVKKKQRSVEKKIENCAEENRELWRTKLTEIRPRRNRWQIDQLSKSLKRKLEIYFLFQLDHIFNFAK